MQTRDENQDPRGTGCSGAQEGPGTRGTNGKTGVEHCGKIQPVGIKEGKNILGDTHIGKQGLN